MANNEIEIVSVNVSAEKGTIKRPVTEAEIGALGIVGDAHAGRGSRQVSLLALESIERFGCEEHREFRPGDFAENLTTKGLIHGGAALLDKLHIGGAVLQVTHIGKKCHGGDCAIFREVGRCVMPQEGLFTRVVAPGIARAGDRAAHERKTMDVRVFTISDRAFRGEYPDETGPAVESLLREHFSRGGWRTEFSRLTLPDELREIDRALGRALADGADAIFAAGGTGIGPRDVTPEAVSAWIQKPMPGVIEAIRSKHSPGNAHAVLSRAVAGSAGECLIYAVPGSVRGATEYVTEILRTLCHALFMVRGIDVH